MRVFLQGDLFCKNFERKHCPGGGVVVVLVSSVWRCPDFCDYVTGVDVFN